MWSIPIVVAFVLGSIPSAVLIGRLAHVDVRGQGSGNPGAANTWRTAGRLAGSVVLVLDAFKGWVAVAWLPALAPGHPSWVPAAAAGAAVLGHVFSPFLGFRGGKGVATSAGAVGALSLTLLLAPLASFAIVFAWRRRASEASLAALLALPLSAFAYRRLQVLSVGLALLGFWAHRRNIRRILAGEEARLTAGGRRR